MPSDSAPAPGGVRPARGRLGGRTLTKRNRRCPVQRRPSPGFLTLWLTPLCFPVTILGSDPSDEVGQLVPSPCWAQDDAAVLVDGQGYTISLTEARLPGYRQRNPDSQAIPPF